MSALAQAAKPRRARSRRPTPRPFLKWVGGKTQLLEQLLGRIPDDIGTYYEPFIGGGALFFALKPERALLGDFNAELIGTYRAVRDELPKLIEVLESHYYEKNYFYEVRALKPETLSSTEAAARTIFLNRAGFNGLYRVNSKGEFNVPFGRYTNPLICDHENLEACSSLLQGAELQQGSFETVLEQTTDGDFTYLDPPYVPLSKTSNFTGYVANGFGLDHQKRLADLLVHLHRKGVRFMLSNAGCEASRKLYRDLPIPGLRIETVQARRSVNSRSSARGKVDEILVLNY